MNYFFLKPFSETADERAASPPYNSSDFRNKIF